MEERFFASDMTKITGVKLNRLQPWMERGFLKPSIQQATGHGTRNIFNRTDLYKIAFFKKLVESGFSRKYAAEKVHSEELRRIDRFLDHYCQPNKFIVQNIWITFSRVMVHGKYKTTSWIASPELDEVHAGPGNPGSVDRIHRELLEGADDIYIINFTKIKKDIDAKISSLTG